jgi:methyl-accepting chemotaxis protein
MTVQERISTLEDIQNWRQQLIQQVLRIVVIIGIPAVLVGSYDAYTSGIAWVIPLYVVAYCVATLATFWKRVPFAFQASVILGVVLALGITDLVSAGLLGDALPYMIAFPFLAVIFFGRRGGILALLLVSLTMIIFGWAFSYGHLTIPQEKLSTISALSRWVSAFVAVLMLAFLLVGALDQLLRRFTEALDQSRNLVQDIRQRAKEEQDQREYLQATVAEYRAFVANVAQGNLIARLDLPSNEQTDDPLVNLGHNLNEMVDNLHKMTAQTQDAAQSLSTAATAILAAISKQAEGAIGQSAAITETAATIDQVRAIAEQTVQRAQGVADLAQQTAEVSQSGQHAVADTIQSTQEIRQKAELIASQILELAERAKDIAGIIATVSEIAAQSNLLALNAAVEAARAGQAGKGFAVVAQEVRSLAEQSREATEQVREILSEIQEGVDSAVMITEEGIEQTGVGVTLSGKAAATIDQLASSVNASTHAAMQIVTAANQQLAGMEQIIQAMENIHQVTADSANSTRQVEQSADELYTLSEQLRKLVERYQL